MKDQVAPATLRYERSSSRNPSSIATAGAVRRWPTVLPIIGILIAFLLILCQ